MSARVISCEEKYEMRSRTKKGKRMKPNKNTPDTGKEAPTASPEVAAMIQAAIKAAVAPLQEQLSQALARGTHDVTAQAVAAARGGAADPAPARPRAPSPEEKVEAELRRASLTAKQVVTTTGLPTSQVVALLKDLREKGKIYNVGTEAFPYWTWKIGDEAGAAELKKTVRKLLSERPMTTKELADATGVRLSRVDGEVSYLRRHEPDSMYNMGHKRSARWFLITPAAKQAGLDYPWDARPFEDDEDPESST